jgi:branched-chain amino acid transport system substrate-binding protein
MVRQQATSLFGTRQRKAAALVAAAGAVVGPMAVAGASSPADADPISIVLMWEVKGESDYGIDSMQNAAELAIQEINDAGGIDGRMIEATRIPASIVDVQLLTSQFLEAEGMDPDLIVGFVAPTVGALTRQVDAAGIPIIGIGGYPLIDGLPVGSEWFFQAQAEGAAAAQAYVDYAVEGLGATNIAVLHTDESYGTDSANAAVEAIEANPDLTLVTNLAHTTTATDFTREVQEAADADVVINYSYPNPLAAQLQAFDQAGLGIPTISGSSASTVAATGLVTPEQLTSLHGVLNCNPADDTREPAADFIAAYTAEYGASPDLIGMVTYDSIRLGAEAIAAAGSTDHAAVADSLRTIDFTDGACAPSWQADAAQIFNHQQVVVSYTPDGAVTEQSIEIAPVE